MKRLTAWVVCLMLLHAAALAEEPVKNGSK